MTPISRSRYSLRRRPSRCGRAWAAGAALAAVAALLDPLWPGTADAAPLVVHVRSRTRLEAGVSSARGRLIVRGRLLDAADAGVEGAPLRVEVRAEPAWHADVQTDADGGYEASGVWPPGADEASVRVVWEGNPAYAPSTFAARLPVTPAPVRASLSLQPPSVRSGAPRLGWQARVTIGQQPYEAAAVAVLLDGAEVGEAVADAEGVAAGALRVPPETAGGVHTLEARVRGERGGALAGTSRRWRFVIDAEVTLERVAGAGCDGASVCLGGRVDRLHGDVRSPLPDAIVRLYRAGSDVPVVTTRSDADGAFAVRADASALRVDGALEGSAVDLLARADGLPGVDPAWSPRVRVLLPPPAHVPDLAWAVALSVMALALLWRGLLRWRRRRRRDAASARSNAGVPVNPVRLADAAGDPNRLSGVLRHGETGRPLAASLTLRPAESAASGPAGARQRQVAAPAGRFVVEGLAPGAWRLHVEAAEHAPLELALTIPHDGRFDGCELLPVSHRARVRQRFADAAQRLSGQRVDWRRETPRAAEPRLARSLRRGHRELRSAVRSVEQALYGPSTTADVANEADAALGRLDEGAS